MFNSFPFSAANNPSSDVVAGALAGGNASNGGAHQQNSNGQQNKIEAIREAQRAAADHRRAQQARVSWGTQRGAKD
jgi:hypothetical protein